jgi:hypothetical protein
MGVVFMTSRFSGPLVWVIAVGTGIASLAAIVFLYRMAWKVDVKAHLRAHERWLAEPRSSRDASVWPFARVSDFEAAKQLPILFRAIPCRRSRHTENLDPRKKAES